VQNHKGHIWKKIVSASSVSVFIDDHCEKSNMSVVSAGLHVMKKMRYVEVNNSVIMEGW
jgi:hypothetical protein